MSEENTCVYLHTRSDGIVFYVGIGSIKRPYEDSGRNSHWRNTTEKYAYTITGLHENLSWEKACDIEIQLIAKYRELSGDKLCNMTTGGDGAKGVFQSAETRMKRGLAHKGKVLSDNHKAILLNCNTGSKKSDETKRRISEAKKNPPEETRSRMRVAKIGKPRLPFSEEHKANMSLAKKADWVKRKSLETCRLQYHTCL